MPRRRPLEDEDAQPEILTRRPPVGQITGVVQRIVTDRGFCFIKDEMSGHDYFCHLSALQDLSLSEMQPGQKVRFTPTDTPKGKRAEQVWRA